MKEQNPGRKRGRYAYARTKAGVNGAGRVRLELTVPESLKLWLIQEAAARGMTLGGVVEELILLVKEARGDA